MGEAGRTATFSQKETWWLPSAVRHAWVSRKKKPQTSGQITISKSAYATSRHSYTAVDATITVEHSHAAVNPTTRVSSSFQEAAK